jgi:hypothetical protein
MELFVARLTLRLKARLRPDAPRRPLLLAIDESQRLKGASVPILLSQLRKAGVSPILLTQFLENWSEELYQAIIGNVTNFLIFGVGPDDATKLAPLVHPYTARDLLDLNRYEALAKIQVGGISSGAFDLRTLRLEAEPNPQHLALIQERTRARYARPRAEVEAQFEAPKSPLRRGWEVFDVSPNPADT